MPGISIFEVGVIIIYDLTRIIKFMEVEIPEKTPMKFFNYKGNRVQEMKQQASTTI